MRPFLSSFKQIISCYLPPMKLLALLQKNVRQNYACDWSCLSAVDTELPFNEADLSCETEAQLSHFQLSFFKHAHELETFERGVGFFYRLAPHGVYQAFVPVTGSIESELTRLFRTV